MFVLLKWLKLLTWLLVMSSFVLPKINIFQMVFRLMQSFDEYLIRWLVQAIDWLYKVVVIIQMLCLKVMYLFFALRSNICIVNRYVIYSETSDHMIKFFFSNGKTPPKFKTHIHFYKRSIQNDPNNSYDLLNFLFFGLIIVFALFYPHKYIGSDFLISDDI